VESVPHGGPATDESLDVEKFSRLGIVLDLSYDRGMVWLRREDLSPVEGSDGETGEVGHA
jgi:hypothetical protein